MPGSPTAAVAAPSSVSAAASAAPYGVDGKDDRTEPAASGIKSEPLEESQTRQSAEGAKSKPEGRPAAVSGTEAGAAQGADEATTMDADESSPAQQQQAQQQLAVAQAGGSVGPDGQAALSPVKSAYESVLMKILEGLRCSPQARPAPEISVHISPDRGSHNAMMERQDAHRPYQHTLVITTTPVDHLPNLM